MKVLSLMLFSALITGCTVHMDASKPPIPAADPILVPKKIPAVMPVKKVATQPIEIIEPSYTTTPVAQPVVSVTNSIVDTRIAVVQPAKVVAHKPEIRMSASRKIVHTGIPATVVQANSVSHKGLFYIVKPKDTVFEVMRQTGVHWKKIIELNQLKSPAYVIHPGQYLRVK